MAAVTPPRSQGATRVVVVTGEDGTEPTPASWHDLHLVRRLARDPRIEPTVVSWGDHPQAGALAAHAPIRTPAGRHGDSLATALQDRDRHALAGRVRDGSFGLWLRAHPRAPALMVGVRAEPAVGWLTARRARVLWLLGPGEAAAMADPGATAGIDRILVPSEVDATSLTDRGVDRARVEVIGPYHLAEPPTPPPEPTVGVVGRLDDDHGIDVLPRVAWALATHLGGPVPVRWASLGGEGLPPMVRSDWARLDLGPLPMIARPPHDLPRFLASVSVVVLPWRTELDTALLEWIAAAGRPCVAFAPAAGPTPPTAELVRFPDVAAVGRLVADIVSDPAALALVAADLADQHGPERTTERLVGLLLESAP